MIIITYTTREEYGRKDVYQEFAQLQLTEGLSCRLLLDKQGNIKIHNDAKLLNLEGRIEKIARNINQHNRVSNSVSLYFLDVSDRAYRRINQDRPESIRVDPARIVGAFTLNNTGDMENKGCFYINEMADNYKKDHDKGSWKIDLEKVVSKTQKYFLLKPHEIDATRLFLPIDNTFLQDQLGDNAPVNQDRGSCCIQ